MKKIQTKKSDPEESAPRLKLKEETRLNKFIATAGVCSRRKADEHIKNGLVKVNGNVVLEMGFKVKSGDQIIFNGKPVMPEKKIYILLNKPKDAISTSADTHGRRTIMDLIQGTVDERIYPVGRLDRNTTGLILLTNDGELAQKLSHPRYEVRKLYQVELDQALTKEDFIKINNGIKLEEGVAQVDDLAYVHGKGKKVIGIQIHIGWNRVVRRIFESLNYKVKKLDRVLYGPLSKKDLPRSKWRHLDQKEIIMLKHMFVG